MNAPVLHARMEEVVKMKKMAMSVHVLLDILELNVSLVSNLWVQLVSVFIMFPLHERMPVMEAFVPWSERMSYIIYCVTIGMNIVLHEN